MAKYKSMGKVIDWVKNNKVTTLLILVVLYLLFGRTLVSPFFGINQLRVAKEDAYYGLAPAGSLSSVGIDSALPIPPREAAPSETQERLVVEETAMSLVVKDVRQTSDQITDHAKSLGGYMVSSSFSKPEEAPYAQVIVRVPSDKLQETLDYFRTLAVKVTWENIRGTDVTDQYEDIGAKLASHEKVKAKFEEILNQATKVQDILQVQRELVNVQSQIDALKGRQKYLEQTAKLAKITAHLSTDEWSLPYAPAKTFRPNVIFKQAVRSLILTFRGLAEKAIWLGVYAAIWAPVLLIILWWKKRKKKTPPPTA